MKYLKNVMEQFSKEEIIKFGQFLEEHKSEDSMSLTELHGMMTAILSSPRLIKPSEWQSYIFGDNSVFEDIEKVNDFFQTLSLLSNLITIELECAEGLNFIFYDKGHLYDFKDVDEKLLTSWCNGYLKGTHFDASWQADEYAIVMLFPIAVLSGQFNLIGEKDHEDKIIEDDTPFKKKYKACLPELILKLDAYWLPKRFAEYEVLQESNQKIGRNAPCTCGSGRKYKKCCYLSNDTLN